MSHFAVTVRIPASVQKDLIPFVVKGLLYPYKENGGWEEDKIPLKKYMTFHDTEDESRKDWETKTISQVRLGDKVFSKYDKRFKNPAYRLFDPDNPEWVYPPEAIHFEQPRKEAYPSFEDYMRGYEEETRDEETGRYGYWENPNKKWDWYRIGGRWSGHFRVLPGTNLEETETGEDREISLSGSPPAPKDPLNVDICRIEALDHQHYATEAAKFIDNFWTDWQLLIVDSPLLKEKDPWDNVREKALRMGILDCKDPHELTGKEWKTRPWGPGSRKPDRLDVFTPITHDDLKGRLAVHFSRLATYAFLDGTQVITLPGNGQEASPWLAAGEMGWWGIDRAEVKDRQHFKESFLDLLQRGNQKDWVVCVDCHI